MSLHYNLLAEKSVFIAQPFVKKSVLSVHEEQKKLISGWSTISKWFGRRIQTVLESVKTINFQEVEEIRLRVRQPLLVQTAKCDFFLAWNGESAGKHNACRVERQDLQEALEKMTYSSIYAAEQELKQGFLTLPGGHRVGVTGEIILQNNQPQTLKNISALNFRLARAITGNGRAVLPHLLSSDGKFLHTLLLSPPRAGKTTMLRELIRLLSEGVPAWGLRGQNVGVVDERGELAGMWQGEPAFDLGSRTDILDACPKAVGMGMLVRSMSPHIIITDELGSPADVRAIMDAIRSGVKIMSSAHAGSLQEALTRPILKTLLEQGIFERVVILSRREGPGTVEKIVDPRNGQEYLPVKDRQQIK